MKPVNAVHSISIQSLRPSGYIPFLISRILFRKSLYKVIIPIRNIPVAKTEPTNAAATMAIVKYPNYLTIKASFSSPYTNNSSLNEFPANYSLYDDKAADIWLRYASSIDYL